MDKKGQVEVTVNWIYILIAGGVILLFFIGIVVKQKAASEESLAADVIRVMENIFTGASVSEKTKNFIDTSGLSEFTLYFDCSEGITEYGLEGRSAKAQNSIDAVFSPRRMKSPQLITWSLPYLLPFKVADLLYITSPNTKYYLYGQDVFIEELAKEGEEFGNIVRMNSPADYSVLDPEKNFQIRIIDTTGEVVKSGSLVPGKTNSWEDEKITGLLLQGEMAAFFQKKGDRWEKIGETIPIVSLGGERDAAKFAAVFSDSPEIYLCGMEKAFQRMEYVTKLYASRADELVGYYGRINPSGYCSQIISEGAENIKTVLGSVIGILGSCRLTPERCDYQELTDQAGIISRMNDELRVNCISLY